VNDLRVLPFTVESQGFFFLLLLLLLLLPFTEKSKTPTCFSVNKTIFREFTVVLAKVMNC
jgi:hypothetical protein